MKSELDCVVVGYGEIALKGGNRRNFERKLADNLRARLSSDGIGFGKVRRVSGRIIVDTGQAIEAAESLSRVFGVTSTSPAVKTKPTLEDIKETALLSFKKTKPKPKSFRVSARRLEKKIKQTSQELNGIVGQAIVDAAGCKVSLTNPELDLGVEVGGREAYVHTQTFAGVGGLPVGVAGRVVVLFSGGIDSPVAAYLAMKRGCEVILLHFSHDRQPPAKLARIRGTLQKYHPEIAFYYVSSAQIEREIVMKVPAKYRIVVLRRVMLRIAEEIAKKEGAVAIATGDNLGQVASQTLTNLDVVGRAVGMLCMRPLIGYDKREIVDLAKKIGTFEDSIEPYKDCCNFLLPKHPATAADLKTIEKIELNLDDGVIKEAVEQALKT